MGAYKAYRSQLITQELYRRLNSFFRQQWREERERNRKRAREQERRINYYTVRRHRLGDRLVGPRGAHDGGGCSVNFKSGSHTGR